MYEPDILAWIFTALAILLAGLLGLNLAYSGRRMNRPDRLIRPLGDLVILGLALPGLASVGYAFYLIVSSSNWPPLAIAAGLAVLLAPPAHQGLGAFLRNDLKGAVLLSFLCLLLPLGLALSQWSI